MNTRLLFTGGGTGGHVMPIIAVARELKKLHAKDNLELHYIGPNDAFSLPLLGQEHFKIHTVASGKIRRYFSFKNITDAFIKMPLGFFQSLFLLAWIRPRLVFCKGGPGSAIVGFCAHILGIPIFLHESDVVPGLSNKIVSRWAKKIFVAFDHTEYFDVRKIMVVGNPVKRELLTQNKEEAKKTLHIASAKPVLLFLGGSQGSEAINDLILSILNELVEYFEVIHVCGVHNYEKVAAEAKIILNKNLGTYYHAYGYLGQMELTSAYAAADFIIARAGSGSIFEIAAVGKPSILIPLPGSAGDHQSKNAYEYAKTGAAVVVEQNNLSPHFLMEKIKYILSSNEELEAIRHQALQFAKPMAAEVIAREILAFLTK